MSQVNFIGFDADDTLWHNLSVFMDTQDRLAEILSPFGEPERIKGRLAKAETENLKVFGYGVKGFTLSMIEAAIEVSGGRIGSEEVARIIELAKEMLTRPIELLENVEQTVEDLSRDHELIVITKGDLFDQETKFEKSGLSRFFNAIEVVSEKTVEAYQTVLERRGIARGEFLMVGNSLKSDIFPVLELGARAVHVPYHSTWAHEEVPDGHGVDYHTIEHIGELPDWLRHRSSIVKSRSSSNI